MGRIGLQLCLFTQLLKTFIVCVLRDGQGHALFLAQ